MFYNLGGGKNEEKKKYIIIGVLVLVIGCLIGLYIFNKKDNTNNDNQVKVVVKKDVNVEVMSEVLSAKDFFDGDMKENVKILYYLGDENVDFNDNYNAVGKYRVVIDVEGTKYETTLNVVDTTKPDLKLKSVSIVVGDKYEINDFVDSCTDNSGDECILSYKEDKVYDKIGTYNIVIIAKDSSGNEIEEQTNLEIVNKKVSNNNNNKSKNTNSKVYFVKTDTESEKEEKDLKYGTKLISWHVKTYNLYSDGSKKVIDEYTHYEVDGKNFNAKTSDMLSEAIENMSIYKNEVVDVVKYTNEFRAEAGVDALKLDETLTKAAMVRAIEMAYSDKLSHERPDGNMCYYIMRDFGQDIYGVGENIASRQRSAKEVSYAWKGSQGHYENMISSSFTRIGVGVIKFYGTYYWVQLFQY